MSSFTIEDRQILSALLEIQIDVLANQAAMAEFLAERLSGGDKEQKDILLADLNHKVKYRWDLVHDKVFADHGSLPEEIWQRLNEKRVFGEEEDESDVQP